MNIRLSRCIPHTRLDVWYYNTSNLKLLCTCRYNSIMRSRSGVAWASHFSLYDNKNENILSSPWSTEALALLLENWYEPYKKKTNNHRNIGTRSVRRYWKIIFSTHIRATLRDSGYPLRVSWPEHPFKKLYEKKKYSNNQLDGKAGKMWKKLSTYPCNIYFFLITVSTI